MVVDVPSYIMDRSLVIHKMTALYPNSKWMVGYDHLAVTIPNEATMIDLWDHFDATEKTWICDHLNQFCKHPPIHEGLLSLMPVGKVLGLLCEVLSWTNVNRRAGYRWTATGDKTHHLDWQTP